MFKERSVVINHDLHLHTPFSNCGKISLGYLKTIYETYVDEKYISVSKLRKILVDIALREYLSNARRLGLKILGFTDHYNIYTNPAIFDILREKVEEMDTGGVTVLVATEADVIDKNGRITVSKEVAEKLDYVITGQHHYHLKYVERPLTTSFEEYLDYCLEDILNSMKNPLVSSIGHPWLRAIRYYTKYIDSNVSFRDIPLEYLYKTCEYSEKYGKPIQIDYSPLWEKEDSIYKGYTKFIEIISEQDCLIFYGSDAHRPEDLARTLQYVNDVLKRFKINRERIWNPKTDNE